MAGCARFFGLNAPGQGKAPEHLTSIFGRPRRGNNPADRFQRSRERLVGEMQLGDLEANVVER
jgi:hypothetical protein